MQMLKCGYLVLVVLLAAAATAEEGGEETLAALKEADNDRGMVMGDGEEKPNKTTTTTTVAPPTTVPKEKVPTFFLAEEGYNCIILKGQITFHIVYEDPKKNMNITVPHDARVSGTCALNTTSPTKAVPTGEDERISLAFDGGKGQGKERVSFVFSGKKEVTKTTGRYALYQVCYDDSCGNLTGFAVNNDMAYVCTPSSTYKDVLNTTDGGMVSLTLASFEAQAFTNSTTFKDEFQCSAMRSNDLVPIIVGSCLAALVVFVLIAYLIGRARAKNSTGYESV